MVSAPTESEMEPTPSRRRRGGPPQHSGSGWCGCCGWTPGGVFLRRGVGGCRQRQKDAAAWIDPPYSNQPGRLRHELTRFVAADGINYNQIRCNCPISVFVRNVIHRSCSNYSTAFKLESNSR